jgi:hypothetical protein
MRTISSSPSERLITEAAKKRAMSIAMMPPMGAIQNEGGLAPIDARMGSKCTVMNALGCLL